MVAPHDEAIAECFRFFSFSFFAIMCDLII